MKATTSLAAINYALEESQEREHRKHLGASVIGGDCLRKIWYGFRWVKMQTFQGRMLRLFERGQLEEARFDKFLALIPGVTIWSIDPNTGKQYRISDCGGHFGGSTDGIGVGLSEIPDGMYFDVEYKTHSDKYFRSIQTEGLCSAFAKHFAQMQVYMHGLGLSWGLYCAVNKNDDDLHLEVVQYQPTYAINIIDRAQQLINTQEAPKRCSGKQGAAFWKCKMCHLSGVCYSGEAPEKNCRTCSFSRPIEGGQWQCLMYQAPIPLEAQKVGCQLYTVNAGIYA